MKRVCVAKSHYTHSTNDLDYEQEAYMNSAEESDKECLEPKNNISRNSMPGETRPKIISFDKFRQLGSRNRLKQKSFLHVLQRCVRGKVSIFG